MPAGFFSGNHAASQRVRASRATVTDELDQQVRNALQRRRRSRVTPIALIVFAVGASACAYLWVNYGDQVRTAVFAIPPATGSTVAASGERPVSRADFDSFERLTTGSIQSATENLEAQKADLEKLSGQVADLVAKVDALRNAVATAPAPPPIRNSISAPPVGQPRPAATAQHKPQAPPKAGPISVGGAPLPPAPLLAR
jgi:hypothetical protein